VCWFGLGVFGDGGLEAVGFDAEALEEAVLLFLVVEFCVGGTFWAVSERVGAFGVGKSEVDCGFGSGEGGLVYHRAHRGRRGGRRVGRVFSIRLWEGDGRGGGFGLSRISCSKFNWVCVHSFPFLAFGPWRRKRGER
jgi:hypothetical protein